jgi:hypothetical protein
MVIGSLVILYVLGYFGYIVFRYIKVPAAALSGAIVAVSLLTSQGLLSLNIPVYIRVFLQTIIGILVGCIFSKERIQEMKFIIVPGGVVAVWMIGTGLASGFLLARFTGLDLGTSLFSAVPGGMTEMSIIAIAYELNVPVVVLFQFMRVLGVYLTVPALASKYKGKKYEDIMCDELSVTADTKTEEKGGSIIYTFVAGGAAGFICRQMGIPAGAIIGPMILVGVLRSLGFPLKPLPKKVILFAQIGLGGVLGLNFTPEITRTLFEIMLPTIVFSLFIVLNGTILAYVVHKVFGWDFTTALLACAAAGVSQMSAIALDMDADAVKVGIIHVIRLAVIVLVVPSLIFILMR